jgi:hypothetical protein
LKDGTKSSRIERKIEEGERKEEGEEKGGEREGEYRGSELEAIDEVREKGEEMVVEELKKIEKKEERMGIK